MWILTAVGVQLPTTSSTLSYLPVFYFLPLLFFKGEKQAAGPCSAYLKSKLRTQNIISDSSLNEIMVDTGKN